MENHPVIDSALPSEMEAVAAIAAQGLPRDFLVRLGKGFLQFHYLPYFLRPPNFCLVARREGRPVGFVAFDVEGMALSQLLSQHRGALARRALARSFSPTFVLQSAGIARLLLTRAKPDPEKHPELALIAVLPSEQGQGVGQALVQVALSRLQQQGVSHCWVKTLESTPRNVRFYEKLGFRVHGRSQGRVYLSR